MPPWTAGGGQRAASEVTRRFGHGFGPLGLGAAVRVAFPLPVIPMGAGPDCALGRRRTVRPSRPPYLGEGNEAGTMSRPPPRGGGGFGAGCGRSGRPTRRIGGSGRYRLGGGPLGLAMAVRAAFPEAGYGGSVWIKNKTAVAKRARDAYPALDKRQLALCAAWACLGRARASRGNSPARWRRTAARLKARR